MTPSTEKKHIVSYMMIPRLIMIYTLSVKTHTLGKKYCHTQTTDVTP